VWFFDNFRDIPARGHARGCPLVRTVALLLQRLANGEFASDAPIMKTTGFLLALAIFLVSLTAILVAVLLEDGALLLSITDRIRLAIRWTHEPAESQSKLGLGQDSRTGPAFPY